MYGWRARIGLLYPSAGVAEPEFHLMAPDGVCFHVTRMKMKKASIEELNTLADNVAEEAQLLADANVDIIAFACTAGSLIGGIAYEREIVKRIQETTGIPAITTTGAVLEALKSLKLKNIALVSPYITEVNLIEAKFLKNLGVNVVKERGLNLNEPFKQAEVNPWQWYRIARQMANDVNNLNGCGLLISCGGIRVVQAIEAIERDTGLPVIASNQALLWNCLKQLGIREYVEGYGSLWGK